MNAQFSLFPLLAPRLVSAVLAVCCALGGSVDPFAISVSASDESSTASQVFRVAVPISSQVAVPDVDSEFTNFDPESGEFPEHVWALETNSPAGLVANFSVDEAFTHQLFPSLQYDARLRLRVASSAGSGVWTTTIQEDATNESAGDGQASVQVESNAPGSASVALKVSLVDDYSSMAQGRYTTTVICTVSMPQ